MAKKTATTTGPKVTERTRWGGALLVLGSVLAMATLGLFLTRPAGMDPSQAVRLAALAANPGALQMEGYVGVFAYLTLALAAFFLVTRDAGARGGFPASAFWIAVGVGSMTLVGVEAVVATSLSPLAAGAAAAPLLVQTVAAVITLLAGIGTFAIGAGSAFVFWGESRAASPAIPAVVAYVGVIGGLATVLGSLAFVTGVRELLVAFYGTYLAYLPFLVMGAQLAFPGLRVAGAAEAETTDA